MNRATNTSPTATRIAAACALLGATAIASPALADDDDLKSGKVIAVQERPYRMAHEFNVATGVLPMDAFYTGLTLGGSYTLHLTELWAWEALSFHYSGNIDRGLENELGERWSVQPEGEPQVQYLIGSHAVFTPLFGKLAFFNETILHASTFFALGGGLIRYDDGFRPMLSAGPGIRFFWGQVVSTRLDIRGALAPDVRGGVEYILHGMLSVSFNFGSSRPIDGDANRDVDDPTDPFATLDELYPLSSPNAKRKEQRK